MQTFKIKKSKIKVNLSEENIDTNTGLSAYISNYSISDKKKIAAYARK